jgi:hypothetical protein
MRMAGEAREEIEGVGEMRDWRSGDKVWVAIGCAWCRATAAAGFLFFLVKDERDTTSA